MAISKVLVFDIETSPIEALVWELKDQNISVEQIVEDWHVIAWAAKWLGEPPSSVMYRDQGKNKTIIDDRALLVTLRNLLDEAHIVLTQNGKNFDSKKLNAKFIELGIKPPSPYKHWDTYQLVRNVAKFTSNKLSYLTSKLCTKYKKLDHGDFPGMSLWKACRAGNPKAWASMRKYNIHDVLSTEELALKLRAWAPESFPHIYDVTDASRECGTCGYVGQMKEGKLRKTRLYSYRQHTCLQCGAWQKGEKTNELRAA